MFRIIGQDGKEYGPTTAEEIRSWIKEGRLNARSKTQSEGSTEWKALGELPEFRDAVIAAATPASTPPVPASAKTSGLAVASLILGVFGIFSFGLTAVVGLILGIVALVKINKSQGQLRGTGVAVAGVVLSGVMVLLLPIMAAMLVPAIARAKSKGQTIQCMNHVKQLNLALLMYASDNRDTLPPAESWCDLIKPYSGGSTEMFGCPSQPPGKCSYGFNAALSHKRLSEIRNPAQTVLVFSAAQGWNQAGGLSQAVPHIHSHNGLTLGFADGHTESANPSRASSLTW